MGGWANEARSHAVNRPFDRPDASELPHGFAPDRSQPTPEVAWPTPGARPRTNAKERGRGPSLGAGLSTGGLPAPGSACQAERSPLPRDVYREVSSPQDSRGDMKICAFGVTEIDGKRCAPSQREGGSKGRGTKSPTGSPEGTPSGLPVGTSPVPLQFLSRLLVGSATRVSSMTPRRRAPRLRARCHPEASRPRRLPRLRRRALGSDPRAVRYAPPFPWKEPCPRVPSGS